MIEKESHLKQQLLCGAVHFAYRKNNGELRIAYGTRNLETIPEDNHPKGTGASPVQTYSYYDLRANGWRSFYLDKLVWVEGMDESCLDEGSANTIAEYKKNNGLV